MISIYSFFSDAAPTVPAGCASGYLGRRRTDLVPTIPSSARDSLISSSRKSLNHSPGRAYSMTRLDQLAKPRKRPDLPSLDERNSLTTSRPLSSSSKLSSITRSMSHLAVGKKPSPTGSTANTLPHKSLNKNDSRSMHHLASVGVHPIPRSTLTTQLREQKLHASTTNNSSEGTLIGWSSTFVILVIVSLVKVIFVLFSDEKYVVESTKREYRLLKYPLVLVLQLVFYMFTKI